MKPLSDTARYSSVKPPRLVSVVAKGKDRSGRLSLCDSCVRVLVRVRSRLPWVLPDLHEIEKLATYFVGRSHEGSCSAWNCHTGR